jgi:glycosyltransferase involved in cell wall biosynthesis
MNVLFVLYHGFESNSALQVHQFANRLGALGWDAAVAVPYQPIAPTALGPVGYRPLHFRDCLPAARVFADGKGPDVVHAWTPREIVRGFCERLRENQQFSLIVHLEDNEECILERQAGVPFATLERNREVDIPEHLSHPTRYRSFLASAQGITVIIDRLDEHVPDGVPWLLLWPGADTERFFPRDRDPSFAARLGIPPDAWVIGYNGNVHPANEHEVRSVYLAAALLSREGLPTVVLRTGRDYCRFLGEDDGWARRHSIELGYIDYPWMPEVLACADVLVQPGKPGPFNDYRFPCKLPEYLAAGRPVVLPATNLGNHLVHGRDALVYPLVDALQIVEAVRALAADRELRQTLARGSVAFATKHLRWPQSTGRLASFYETVVADATGVPHASIA